MELDDEVCHTQCNVGPCCFQQGACAALLFDELTEAQVLTFDLEAESDATKSAATAIYSRVMSTAAVEVNSRVCVGE